MNLQTYLQQRLRTALVGITEDQSAADMVRPAQNPKFGDYQANCAMGLAKKLGKKPRDIATQIANQLRDDEALASVEVAGPGFINIRFRDDWLAARLTDAEGDIRLGVAATDNPRTYVIDFSSPNIAKPLHVGHLRSTIIGDSLARLLRFRGHRVITDNHLGDWGTQFGMILYGYKHFLDEEHFRQDPVGELSRLYKEVRRRMKDEESFPPDAPRPVTEAARLETAKLHDGDEENRRLWESLLPFCRAEIETIYRRLDIKFDYELGESFYHNRLPGVVEDLLRKGVAEESQGAIVVFFGENEPPALIRKSDGAFTYMTTDLATIQFRIEEWHPNAILYVVDFRQKLHFQQLFTIARRWGYGEVELEHISFGSVLGEDGRPLKTREGTAAPLAALLDEAVAEAKRVYAQSRQERIERGDEVPELAPDELEALAEIVGIGAVKYADLSQNRTSDYVFSLPKMLAMNGNTATYMQYAYVRNRGIFRKGNIDVQALRSSPPAVFLGNEHERALGLKLLQFEEAVESAIGDYQPSAVTSYLWDLSKAYSSFFVNCPVLKAETDEMKQSRLVLCDLTARTIKQGLELLGIKTPERM